MLSENIHITHPQLAAPIRPLIVTTGTTARAKSVQRSRQIAEQLNALCLPRRNGGGGLFGMLDDSGADRAVIVEEYGLAIAHRDGTVFRWHPNLGFVRALNLLRGQADIFAEATQLAPGDRVLDCTLGFGSEALIAAMLVGGSGQVVGLESVPELALVTAIGMRERSLAQKPLMEAVRRIEVVNADYRNYLQSTLPGAYDVICFDPFFESRVEGSAININPLLRFGNPHPLDTESVIKAFEITTRRVVVKHPLSEELPQSLTDRRSKIVKGKRSPVRYSIFEPHHSNS